MLYPEKSGNPAFEQTTFFPNGFNRVYSAFLQKVGIAVFRSSVKKPGWPDWANFLPMGNFLLVSFWITYVAKNVGLLFVSADYVLILTKLGWAKVWVIFFTNSSGHPGQNLTHFRFNRFLEAIFHNYTPETIKAWLFCLCTKIILYYLKRSSF
jgi:hypothetical protein